MHNYERTTHSSTGGGPPRLPATSSKRSNVKASVNTGTVGSRCHGRTLPSGLVGA